MKWETKFIKADNPVGSGRPTIQKRNTSQHQQRRQKKEEYYSESFQKRGTAKLFINPGTKKIFLRHGSKSWMTKMISPLIPIFSEKCITNNRVESKHSQIKRTGNLRKQQNRGHADKLFQLQEYIVKNRHLPETFLEGKPLYRYLILNGKKRVSGYQFYENEKKMIQTIIPAYI